MVFAATAPSGADAKSAFASATYIVDSHTVILKLVNVDNAPLDVAIHLNGVGTVEPNGTATVLSGDPKAINTAEDPTAIAPKQEPVTDASASFHRTLPPHSFTVLRLNASPK